ncbi:MAG: oxidoreductase [Anaerolineae bacterium]
MDRLWHLFQPITIGGLELTNRTVMAPMVTNYCSTDGAPTSRLMEYLGARARGGVGLLVVEASYVRPDGKGFRNELGIHSDDLIPALRELTRRVHEEGSKISIQLFHAGRQTSSTVTGEQPLAPSPLADPSSGELPRELTTAEVTALEDAFAAAARRAQAAGFDAVEVHGAHGYLVNQFLSPFSNRRTDEYGGNTHNRVRFAVNIVRKVRRAVGEGYPVFFRLSADEYVPGGITLSEAKLIAAYLQEAGVDALSVSAGNYASPGLIIIPTMDLDPGLFVPLAAGVKQAVSLPVIAVGRLHDPMLAAQVIAEGSADLVALGRALLTDPDWVRKAERGDIDDIRPCISCNQACIANLLSGQPITCLLNPACGREQELAVRPAGERRRVVVVGGGPAGLEAARVAAERGHSVTLFEEHARLGGEFAIAAFTPRKEELSDALRWMIRAACNAGVDVRAGERATAGRVLQERPDAVIVATGGRPKPADVAGLRDERTHLAREVLMGAVAPGRRVLVAGGGGVGLATAELLAQGDRQVTIVEQLEAVGADLSADRRYWLLADLVEHNVGILTHTSIRGASDGGVLVSHDGHEERLGPFDDFVVALGYEGDTRLQRELAGRVPEVYAIGDAVEPRSAVEAIREGAEVALRI